MSKAFRFDTDKYIEEIKKRFSPDEAKRIIKNYENALYRKAPIGGTFTKQDMKNMRRA